VMDYLELAKECGAIVLTNGVEHRVTLADAALAAFAERVRAQERERCATECEKRAAYVRKVNTHRGRIGSAALFAADQVEVAAEILRHLPAAILAQQDPGEPA
jgi:muconolactone delta-isomerase